MSSPLFSLLVSCLLSVLVWFDGVSLVTGGALCQSYDSVVPTPALWSSLFTSTVVTGPIFITSPIVYDVESSQVVGGIFINSTGALYFLDGGLSGVAVELTTDFISVEGLLQAGSSNCPFTSQLTFNMQGLAPMPYLAHQTATPMLKAIVVWAGGEIELHGSKALTAPNGLGVSWTRLEGTLDIGATSMRLNDSVTGLGAGGIFDWQVGDRLVLTTTDFDPYESEELVITGFTASNVITFSPPLQWSHFGAWTFGSDQRASVGLLTRNILITTNVERWFNTSDPISSPGTLGTHVMIMSGFKASHVEGVSILKGGQGDFQARYPFHWHLCAAVPDDTYFRASVIEDSLFRGVTIHGTQYALVENIVAYNISGHCWFLEDGAEWGNVINHNLAVLVRLKTTGFVLGSDIVPFGLSTYWQTNPNNTFTNNIAAGSEGTGVWFEMHGAVEGPSFLTGLYNGYQPFMAPQAPMQNNIWHSMIHGLNLEGGGFDPNDRVPFPNPVQLHQNLAGLQPPLSSNGGRQVVINNHFWKIGQEGFWARAFQVDVINCTFADCGGDCLQIAGSGGHPTQRGAGRIINTLFVGLSENRGNQFPPIHTTGPTAQYQQWVTDIVLGSFSLPNQQGLVGFRIYDGPNHLINCTFTQYPDFQWQTGGGQSNIAIAPRNGNVFFMQSLTSIESTTFTNVVTKFRSIDPSQLISGWSDGSKNTVIYDIDGSLSGNPFYYCVPHEFGFYQGEGCVINSNYDMCCPQQYLTSEILCLDREAFGGLQLPACPPVNIMHQVRLDVNNDDLSVNFTTYDLPMSNGNEQWNTLWSVNSSYLISFDQYTPGWTGFQMANTYRGDWVEFAFCLPPLAVVSEVVRGRASAAYGTSPTWAIYSQYSPIQAVNSLADFMALGATIEWPNAGGYYYYDTERNIVHVHVQSRSLRTWGSGDVNSDYCGLHGCDFIVVHTTGDVSGVPADECAARAFNSSASDGSLQVQTGSAFFNDFSPGPRINGPVQHTTCGDGCLFIDAGADAFYAQQSAPIIGDQDWTDDRGLYWAPDDAFQLAPDARSDFASGFDHRVSGDIYNAAYMYQSTSTGDFQYEFNLTSKNTYVLSLWMIEVFWTQPGNRTFNVLINGDLVWPMVDIIALTGSKTTALQLHSFVNLTSASSIPQITVVSQRVQDNPIISGITIMPYDTFVNVFPEFVSDIRPGTSSNAPPIATPPPVGGGGGGGNGPPSLPVPAGWVFISPANTSFVTGGIISTISNSVVVNPPAQGVALNSWEAAQPQLFRTNRFGGMQYSIPLQSEGDYVLRILFAENFFSTIGSRVFSVSVQGETVLSHIDLNTFGANSSVPATTGTTSNIQSTTAYVYQQTLSLTAAALNVSIDFIQERDNPLHCGIEIIPAALLAVSSSSSSAAPSASSSNSVPTQSSTAAAASSVGF